MSNQTAGIIVIGDEMLKGQTVDTNSPFLCKRLHGLGIKLCKISVVSDDVNEIAEEIITFSRRYNIVLTSGGIGPTHDDVTYAAVAKAFDEPLTLNKEVSEILCMYFPGSATDVTSNPALKMALIPESSKLLYPKAKDETSFSFYDVFPIVCVSNVFIFPGIPEYLEHAFVQLEHIFRNPDNSMFHVQSLYINRFETDFVLILNRAVELHKDVTFGSYPVLNNGYCTQIIMESATKDCVFKAREFLKKELPTEWIVNMDYVSRDDVIVSVYETVLLSTNTRLIEVLKNSVKVLEECFQNYSPDECFLSFNGGKDCTVLLHLVCAVLWKNHPEWKQQHLQAMYIRDEDPFPQVEKFIEDAVARYSLDLKIMDGPIRSGLENILKEKPNLKAVLMGVRRTDPHGKYLQPFQMTDNGWPSVIRVHSILDWDYQDVWAFLGLLSIPYCSLYDEGYTSIDSRQNTKPNPRLCYVDSNGETKYHPAYTLQDTSAERSGRD